MSVSLAFSALDLRPVMPYLNSEKCPVWIFPLKRIHQESLNFFLSNINIKIKQQLMKERTDLLGGVYSNN